MSKKFLNLHVLISHSPSCLNRDDMNMQKTAVFGGARRVRVSSQCLKRAIRKSPRYREFFGSPSIRTTSAKDLAASLKKREAFAGYGQDLLELVASLGMDGKEVMTAWSLAELAELCRLVAEAKEGGGDDKALKKLVKDKSAGLKHAVCDCVDVALSGRMCASGMLVGVEAAASVAHAITTHKVDAEIDWFTAMDDLREEAEEAGAGHLNTQEFGSGVFYRFACVDLDLLTENLGKPRQDALDIAAGFAELLATVVPSGKQKSFASYAVADYLLASFSTMPLSAANAFEKPVASKNGLMAPSIKSLEDYWTKVHAGYGLDDDCAVFSLEGTGLPESKTTLAELTAWIKGRG